MLTVAFVDPILIQLGPLAVRYYGIIFVSGILVAIWTSMRAAKDRGLDPEFVPDISMVIVPAGILGARLWEVFVLQWPYYQAHPTEILSIWLGGLAIHGGVLGSLLAGWGYVVYRKQSLWVWADVIAPGLVLAQAIGRWGNFFNQEAFGGPAPQWLILRMPGWLREGMTIDGTVMHPTFLYESLWNVLVFLALYAYQRRKPPVGSVFGWYFILYNIGRFTIESIREDSSYIFGHIRTAQVVALAEILAGVALWLWAQWRERKQAA